VLLVVQFGVSTVCIILCIFSIFLVCSNLHAHSYCDVTVVLATLTDIRYWLSQGKSQTFSALMLLVGRQQGHLVCKKCCAGSMGTLEKWAGGTKSQRKWISKEKMLLLGIHLKFWTCNIPPQIISVKLKRIRDLLSFGSYDWIHRSMW